MMPKVITMLLIMNLLCLGCAGTRPVNLGVEKGALAPCPASPNCVSSQAHDQGHAIDPFPLRGPSPEAVAELKRIIRSFRRTDIVSATETYIHAEFRSALFGFTDDVEFYCDEKAGVIHVRSASRVGRSDFGVNRKRIEAIRAQWETVMKE